MRGFLIATVLGVGALTFGGPSNAGAHEPARRGAAYYGNGWHDAVPHRHRTYTPYGSYSWYGNGLHDYLPHNHRVSPWGGVRSYSITPFGPTKSYNSAPYYRGYYGGFYRGW